MFTIKQIRNGTGYFRNYLAVKDYYSEGARTGAYWLGAGAELLGLDGTVEFEAFQAIANNRIPGTGERLTQRTPKNSLHDITFSAPKAVSLLAVLGEDNRVTEAFRETVEFAHRRLESYAAVRMRGGSDYHTENVRFTNNLVSAVFLHDDSRALEPQLHSHIVTANASYDLHRDGWYALQPRFLMEATKSSIRREAYEFLASRLHELGYGARIDRGTVVVDGITETMERKMSTRSGQKESFRSRYLETFGREASKRRIEQFIKEGRRSAEQRFRAEYSAEFGREPSRNEVEDFVMDSREGKPERVSSDQIRQRQCGKWTEEEWNSLRKTVQNSFEKATGRQDDIASARESYTHREETTRTHGERCRPTKFSPGSPLGPEKRKRDSGGKKRAHRAIQRGRAVSIALRGHPGMALAYIATEKARRRSRSYR